MAVGDEEVLMTRETIVFAADVRAQLLGGTTARSVAVPSAPVEAVEFDPVPEFLLQSLAEWGFLVGPFGSRGPRTMD